ncbi:putative annexin [Xylona heveae TC161]|uniref:Putative annexin n=1 Tax=Xylona heveae (strain CBS 132557 / TC161) TaxID=1328760 RepID=A0A165G2J7_XYLHT|nr:putative annexin [Xylona heveae TC161]KZF21665.1 putative annexin [Xylona heveae TC161]
MPVAGDAPMEAEALRSAMKGFGTNEGTLIKVLAPADPLLMTRIRETYKRYFNRDLQQDIIKETSGRFEDVLVALVRGPLQNDVHNIRSALKGAGTNETVLDDALLGRSNADMHAIQREYQRTFNRNLLDDVRGDLSFKTEVLYEMVLSAQRDEESPHINPQLVDQDANQLHQAIKGKLDKTGNGNKQQSVCHIMTKRSDGHLRAVAHHYERTYHKSLEEAIKKEFTGHMEHALLHILRGATDRAMRDAVLLEDCMRGLGTRDDLLVQRVVRVHWDRDHMRQVRGAYKHRYNKELATRIAKETSGDYERALVACVSV